MRAAVTVAPGDTRIEEVPDPACGSGDMRAALAAGNAGRARKRVVRPAA